MLAHDFGLRKQNRRRYRLARAPAHCLFAHREGLEQGRMRLLVGLRHDVDLLHAAQFVDFAVGAQLARPLVRRPGSAFFVRIGILVVLALEAERLLAPCELEDAENFLERFAVDAAVLALIADGRADMDLLRHLVKPARLVAARKADEGAPLAQLAEPW